MAAEHLASRLPPFLRGRLTALAGGHTNRCFRLDTRQGRYWLRIGCEAPARLGIHRGHELMAHRAAAEAGLAPPVRYADSDTGLLVLDWLNEPDWREKPGRLDSLMPRVAHLHRLPAPALPVVDLHQRAQSYLRQLESPSGWLSEALFTLAGAEPHTPVTPVLCHCDLTAGNLMGTRPWLLDWEYACLADPAFELAVIADDRGLSRAECTTLLAHYNAAGGNVSPARLQGRLPWVQLLSLLWAMVQYQHTQAPEHAAWMAQARARLRHSLE